MPLGHCQITLRPAAAEDEALLYSLFVSARPEMSSLPERLLRMQHAAQKAAYASQYPECFYQMVMRDNRPVGKIWLARCEDSFRLVDIVLLPEARNAGIGSELMHRVQAQAREAGMPVLSSVWRSNTASLRFHQRHGFLILDEDDVQFHLEWR